MTENRKNIKNQEVPHWSDPGLLEFMLDLEQDGYFASQRTLIDAEEERSQKHQTYDSYAKSQTFDV